MRLRGQRHGQFQDLFEILRRKELFRVTDAVERGPPQSLQGRDFRVLDQGMAQGPDEEQLGGAQLGVACDPGVEGLGDGCLPGRQSGLTQDVTQESARLAVGCS